MHFRYGAWSCKNRSLEVDLGAYGHQVEHCSQSEADWLLGGLACSVEHLHAAGVTPQALVLLPEAAQAGKNSWAVAGVPLPD